jgi:hypothetical protein
MTVLSREDVTQATIIAGKIPNSRDKIRLQIREDINNGIKSVTYGDTILLLPASILTGILKKKDDAE